MDCRDPAGNCSIFAGAAYWGWFECEDDAAVANALYDSAFDWARKQGCVRVIGPMSPNANDIIGCQIEGFEGSQVLLVAYNPVCYDRLIQDCGNRKWKDLVAWLLANAEAPERLAKFMPHVEAKGGFKQRNVNMKDFKGEIERFNELYKRFEQVNAVLTPMTPAELGLMAKRPQDRCRPRLYLFCRS